MTLNGSLGVPRFVTKDSGRREVFETGSRRDTQQDKPRYDLIPPQALKRVAELYQRGADKYGDHNWAKGQPMSRFLASAMRHAEQWRLGERDEDHAAAVVWNWLAIMCFEGTSFDDSFDWSRVGEREVPRVVPFQAQAQAE